MEKKKIIDLIFMFLISLSLLITIYGIYIINNEKQQVLMVANEVEKYIIDISTPLEESKNKEITDSIGMILFKDKKIGIFNGLNDNNLKKGVGKYINQSVLNERGNSILFGHRETSFKFLKDIQIGDIFEIKTKEKTIKYIVKKTYVTKIEDEQIYQESNNITVTFVTCYPFIFKGAAKERFIVESVPLI